MFRRIIWLLGQRRRAQGFTLVEILVVVVIIGLLAGLVAPKIFKKVDDARVKTAQEQIRELGVALDLYRLDFGEYPSSLEALLTTEGSGPYLSKKRIPLDPWGNPYNYQLIGDDEYLITSSGGGKEEIRSDM
jgi:general secretion pathway protein G